MDALLQSDLARWIPWVSLVAVLGLVLAWWRAATATARGNARRGRLSRRAERRAESLLDRLGFSVEDRQVTASWPISVDGEVHDARLRADLLVTKGRRRYAAEVKSTSAVARPTEPSTRRQLLEYLLALDVDGVLLVDMAHRRVLEIDFPELRR